MLFETKNKLLLVQEHYAVQLKKISDTYHTNAFKGIYGTAKIEWQLLPTTNTPHSGSMRKVL